MGSASPAPSLPGASAIALSAKPATQVLAPVLAVPRVRPAKTDSARRLCNATTRNRAALLVNTATAAPPVRPAALRQPKAARFVLRLSVVGNHPALPARTVLAASSAS